MNKLQSPCLALVAALLLMAAPAGFSANIQILNNDGAGEGFNDPTPAMPEGGNPGETLGEQRLNAMNFAADLVGSKVISNVTIPVNAEFNPQQCSPGNATLGAGGAETLVSDFPNAPRANTFYAVALANALAGRDLDPDDADIGATFNSSIDNNELCLEGTNWYYGFDNNPPDGDLDFLSTASHELIHGLGFATFTNLRDNPSTLLEDECGRFFMGIPDIYAVFIRNLPGPPNVNATWPELTRGQRCSSVTNDGNVVWDGASTTANGTPSLDAPASANGANSGQVQLFAPTPRQNGSSISHWDTEVNPNALMEPFETNDIRVIGGIGLSACLLQDIGWQLQNARCPDNVGFNQNAGSGGDDGSAPTGGDGTMGAGSSANGSNGGGGGGGCTLAAGAFDPLFPVLLILAMIALGRRQRV